MKAAIYVRVSTDMQDLDKQKLQLQDYCNRNNIEVYAVYEDIISGTKDSRPSFNQLLQDMRQYKFDTFIVTKFDRIGRSLQHLLRIFEEMLNHGVNIIATTQQIDTSSSAGKFQLQMLGAMAEFERAIISERTREALKYAKNVGKRGKDRKPRKKRGALRKRISYIGNGQKN